MALAAGIEPLHAANELASTNLYRAVLYGIGRRPVETEDGISITPHESLRKTHEPNAVFVCSGDDAESLRNRATLDWVRRQARRNIAIGGIGAGVQVLALAGILDGYRCAVTHRDAAALGVEFPDIVTRFSALEIDRNRLTCAADSGALDLTLSLIGAEHGRELARAAADYLVRTGVGVPDDDRQEARLAAQSPRTAAAIDIMKANLETPLRCSAVASRVGLSMRQLERLFAEQLACTPRSCYGNLRLEHARGLLMKTDMSILDAARAAGYTSETYFRRRYSERFATTPAEERQRRS